MSTPKVDTFYHEDTHTFSCVGADPAARRAAVIDPVLNCRPSSRQTGTTSVDARRDRVEEERLQVGRINIRAGRLPPAEGNGVSCPKIPVDAFPGGGK